MEEDYYDGHGRIRYAQPQTNHNNTPNRRRPLNANNQQRRGGPGGVQNNQNRLQYGWAQLDASHGMVNTAAGGASHNRRGVPRRFNSENRRSEGAIHDGRNDNRNQNIGKGFPPNRSPNHQNVNRSRYADAHHSRGVSADNSPPRDTRRQNKTDTPQREWKPGYGYKKLLEISTMDSNDILLHFNNDSRNFAALLNDDLKPDIIVLAVKCISSVCTTAFDGSKLNILLSISNSNFLNVLEKYVTNLPYETHSSKERNKLLWGNMDSFWNNVFQMCNGIMDLLPSKAVDCLPKFIDMVEFTIQRLGQPVISCAVQDMFKRSKEKFLICIEKANQKQDEIKEGRAHSKRPDAPPPDDFREIEIMPTVEELTVNQKPYLRANIIDGAYENVDHYLDVQFRLLREDFICPLRKGIIGYLDNPAAKRFENIRVYKNVLLNGLTVMRGGGMGMVVVFKQNSGNESAKKKKSESKKSMVNAKRFMFGSLVCFTDDEFKTIFFATVSDRDKIADGEITVTMDEYFDAVQLNNTKFLMVESEVYFLPYYYVLKALQRPSLANFFPMEKYIVNVDPNVHHPKYLNAMSRYRICNGAFVPILHEQLWPHVDDVGLDETQYAAYKMALTKEFVTIQGPPGTGKTFVGLKVAKTLLQNEASLGTPILVVCYTNHALDQFLEGLLEVTDNLVRIGGQSKNETLQEFNLQYLRRQQKKQRFKGEFYKLTQNVGKLRHRINLIQSRVIVDLAKFNYALDIDIVQFLKPFNIGNNRFSVVNWLLMSDMVQDAVNLKINYEESKFCIDDESDDGFIDSDSEDDRRRRLDLEDEDFQIPDVRNVNFFSAETLADEIKQTLNIVKTSTNGDDIDRANMQAAILRNQMDFLTMQLSKLKSANYIFCDPEIHTASSFNVEQRWGLYWQWIQPILQSLNEDFFKQMIPYKRAKDNYDELLLVNDRKILMNARVVGITTTGAAKLQTLLKSLGSRIVIVEEAAEVMESHIIVSMSRNCEHLIMIGDHQQLRPVAATYHLTRNFNLDISLFERMVKNGNHCYQLGVQHRMRPEIAALIAPTIYPNLTNHPEVYLFPSVKGVVKSLAFVSHEQPETKEESISSRFNTHEAKFILCLAKYLIQQGYQSEDITILAAYSGQMFHLKKERARYAILSRVRITVLDSYQGEESKIILLSLVRSNPENNIGFLSIENRVCVALSRAKEGFYIIGNMSNMMHKSDLWKEINKTLMKQDAVGNSLTLKCEIHLNTFTKVQNEKDFDKVPEGGCSQICDTLLKCGHHCLSVCHSLDREHEQYLCTENCERQVCIYGHKCPDVCFKECEPCKVLVERQLPCGHSTMLRCYTDTKKYDCRHMVPVVLELCGHETKKQCHVNPNEVECPAKCIDRLPCGHACTQLCHKDKDPDHVDFLCNEDCPRLNKGCVNEHTCKKRCYEDCNQCTILVIKKRDGCPHKDKVECQTDVNSKPCKNKCSRRMPCGHFCKQLCFEQCTDCRVMVKKLRSCGHEVEVYCGVDVEAADCAEKCNRILKCGHKCRGICANPCDVNVCRALVDNPFTTLCGHKFTIPCSLTKLDADDGKELVMSFCKEPCKATLKGCEHNCSGTCGDCHGGVLHTACKEPCGHLLVCGHSCDDPCREACPPCKKPCQVICGHSKCPMPCGVPCPPCKEKCKRGCRHRKCLKLCGDICNLKPCMESCLLLLECKHPCQGMCGEICPPICKICKYDEFPTIFFGDEEDEDARFIKLVDCPHSVEVKALDKWVENDSDGPKKIGIRLCPHCNTPIVNTLRYSDYVKRAFLTIDSAKKKVFGDDNETIQKLKTCQSKIRALSELSHMKKGTGKGNWNKFAENLLRLIASNIPKVPQPRTFVCRLSKLDADRINTQIDILDKMSKLYLTAEKLRSPILDKKLKSLLTALSECRSKISEQQSEDFSCELLRTERLIHYLNIEATFEYRMSRMNVQVILSSNEIKSFLTLLKPFTESVNIAVGKELTKLKSYLKVHILTDTERRMIVSAVGLKQGHWFECPNGHPYCIGECGGAMEEASCPECGVSIGGNSHALLSNNRLATRMDGARHAAWSDTANMANYGLD